MTRSEGRPATAEARASPRRTVRRRILIALALLALSPLLLLIHPRARAALRLKLGFRPLPQDARVFYEPGAEAYAAEIAKALPGALARVDECHARPFISDLRVYVCSSHESFARHLAQDPGSPVRGMALARDVWVSPKALAFFGRDTHRETVAHELSHLHLDQHLGWWRRARNVPKWFVEGLADWVADTGHERVSRAEAIEGLRGGRHFVPDASGRVPIPKGPQDYGVGWPLLHMQSRMFVEYLNERNTGAFRRLMNDLLDGSRFDAAFAAHFGADLDAVWRDFLESVRTHAKEGGPSGRASP